MDSSPVPQASTQQPSNTPVVSPMSSGQPPFLKRIDIKKFLNLSTWIFLFTFLPITILIFLSQDSIPGDFFYPVKRGMEGVVLAAASVSPATRTAFKTDLTERRFDEAQALVLSQSSTQGLITFTEDVEAVQQEISALSNSTDRANAEKKLINKLEQYQTDLLVLEVKARQNIIASQPPISTPTPTSVSSSQNFVVSSPIPTTMSKITPVLVPSQSYPTSTPTPIPTTISIQELPTLTPAFTPIQTVLPTPTVVAQITQQPEEEEIEEESEEKVIEEIKKAKERVDKIKEDLEKKRGDNNKGENSANNNRSKKEK